MQDGKIWSPNVTAKLEHSDEYKLSYIMTNGTNIAKTINTMEVPPLVFHYF